MTDIAIPILRSAATGLSGPDIGIPPVVPVPAGTPAGTTPQHARKFKIAGGGRGELRRRNGELSRAVKRLKPRQMETPWLTCEWAQGIEDEANHDDDAHMLVWKGKNGASSRRPVY